MRGFWYLPLALALLLAAACGDDGGGAPATSEPAALGELQPQPQPVQALDAAATAPQDGVIDVQAQGIAFAPNRLTLPLGQPVIIRLNNGDPVPHRLTIAGVDGQYETEDDATTGTVDGQATGELTFSPQIPGAYTFRCDIHPGQMGGQIIVEG